MVAAVSEAPASAAPCHADVVPSWKIGLSVACKSVKTVAARYLTRTPGRPATRVARCQAYIGCREGLIDGKAVAVHCKRPSDSRICLALNDSPASRALSISVTELFLASGSQASPLCEFTAKP